MGAHLASQRLREPLDDLLLRPRIRLVGEDHAGMNAVELLIEQPLVLLGDLAEAYALGRRSTIVMLRNLKRDAWLRRGIASDNPITVNAIAYIIVGHERHHLAILRERYGL